MIDEARAAAARRGLADRTRYLVDDFATMDAAPSADITLLDKVICCYPDVERLVGRSASNTSSVYGFTMPHRRWYTRLGAAAASLCLRLIGSDFRPYTHSPAIVDGLLRDRGFEHVFEASTPLWLTRVYRLAPGVAPGS